MNIKDILTCRFDQKFDIVALLKLLLPIFGFIGTRHMHILL